MSQMMTKPSEPELIKERYQRRKLMEEESMYGRLRTHSLNWRQEKERALVKLFREEIVPTLGPLNKLCLLEVGCGDGTNLLDFISLGFLPQNLTGNDLLEERVQKARQILPTSAEVYLGDAAEFNFKQEYYDLIYLSTVLSSILDDNFQEQLANHLWEQVKPGGGVLLYDFIFNNPKNKDVKGVSQQRIRELFPHGNIQSKKITLAPPLARLLSKIHPGLYHLFNIFPFLRSHVLCWIKKDSNNEKL